MFQQPKYLEDNQAFHASGFSQRRPLARSIDWFSGKGASLDWRAAVKEAKTSEMLAQIPIAKLKAPLAMRPYWVASKDERWAHLQHAVTQGGGDGDQQTVDNGQLTFDQMGSVVVLQGRGAALDGGGLQSAV